MEISSLSIILPFSIGLAYLFVMLIIRGIKWISGLSKIDKLRFYQSFKTLRVVQSIIEAFREGLLHVSIFKKNRLLGYMHMSLAFGWFLLIVVGHVETMLAEKSFAVPLYIPIFLKYFHTTGDFFGASLFSVLMDFLLLFVLSGLTLAMLKRLRKSLFGLKRTTRLRPGDQIALTSLWLIFPLRLLAESAAAAQFHNGGPITNNLGQLLFENTSALTIHGLFTAYSVVLGMFFVALPNSRYMHIPTEILFIFLRNSGIRLKKRINTYTDVQVFSCSRCGICLDNCQMSEAGITNSQSVYLLKNIRNNKLQDEHLFNCLLCGKCQADCPVGIDTIGLRITQRIESTRQYNSSYNYLEAGNVKPADVIYFAGCMTHLSPGIITAMKQIFTLVNEDYWFLDEEKAPCCGRPLMLAGQFEAAEKLISNNTYKIKSSGAKKLIVSCPICYKVFKEDYELHGIEIQMHFDYILQKIDEGKLNIKASEQTYVYHDPCELGRGMGIYEPPRELLNKAGTVITVKNEKEKAYCCGGSLGNLKISQPERNAIRNHAIDSYAAYQPDVLVTSCPLCKKTFARNKKLPVLDIAEIVVKQLGYSIINENKPVKVFCYSPETV